MIISPPIPLILDTDIGDDIDDVFALAVILNSPELDLHGVSTVFVDVQKRAALARKVLSTWGRTEVPVAAGCSNPLLQSFAPQAGHQFQVLQEAHTKSTFPHAVDFLVQALDIVKNLPSEQKLTLVTIGPLTNVALALAREPRLAQKMRLFMMGGQGTKGDKPAWNIRNDPEAAAIVFRSGIEIWEVGYDITTQVRLEQKHLNQIAQSNDPHIQLIARLLHLWQNGKNKLPFLHDPLAVLALFTDCLQFEERNVDIKLCGSDRGIVLYSPPSPDAVCARVATAVDVSRTIDIFMQRLLNT